jgi:hypothetical protein
LFATAALLPVITGCGDTVVPVALGDARSQLSSPKPRYYLFQTIGPGHEVPGDERAQWFPAAAPDEGKRIVIRIGADERLEHAAVITAGPDGEYDRIEEVLFDRAQWRDLAQTSRQ